MNGTACFDGGICRGYHNLPLAPEAQKILTFTCSLGTYSSNV